MYIQAESESTVVHAMHTYIGITVKINNGNITLRIVPALQFLDMK